VGGDTVLDQQVRQESAAFDEDGSVLGKMVEVFEDEGELLSVGVEFPFDLLRDWSQPEAVAVERGEVVEDGGVERVGAGSVALPGIVAGVEGDVVVGGEPLGDGGFAGAG
jgi:hypothetical protein